MRTLETSAKDLWRHIFSNSRELLQIWTGVRTGDKIDEESIQSKFFNYPTEVKAAEAWAMEKSDQGADVYFCAHLLTRPRRIKGNAGEILSLWGELDGASIPNGSLKPTAVVESSPGHYHCYWRLTDPIPPEVAENYNRRLAHAVGADPSGFDLSQLLRVPGTENHKYQDAPTVRIVEIAENTYVPTELETSLPEIEKPQTQYESKEDEEEPPVALNPKALKVWRGEEPKLKEDGETDRSASLVKIGRVLYNAGANRRVVTESLQERDISLGWRCYTDRRDADKQYAAILNEIEKNGRTPQIHIISGGSKEERKPQFPKMDDAAFNGPFGKAVELIDPHTEGDPVAVLINMITAFGNAVGRGPYMQVGATRHHVNLFCGIVGSTAKGRKGTAWDPVKDIMHAASAAWAENRIVSGLSSGEGLINEVRDRRTVDKDGEQKVIDQGEPDKRLLIVEGELAQALKVLGREGNTLSPILRNAWDGTDLRTMVKNNPLRATNPHISVLGHITQAELTRHLTETEMANGLANRVLWILVERSKSLPFGGEWYTVNLQPISREIVDALKYTNREFRMEWAEDAKPLWVEAYKLLTKAQPGMFGAIIARAEAQALRLAMLYALADCSQKIHEVNLQSALAVWEYAEESARLIFGDLIGDPDADKALSALRAAENGMARTEVRDLFGRNKGAEELDRILGVLLDAERVLVTKVREGGSKRPIERWYAP